MKKFKIYYIVLFIVVHTMFSLNCTSNSIDLYNDICEDINCKSILPRYISYVPYVDPIVDLIAYPNISHNYKELSINNPEVFSTHKLNFTNRLNGNTSIFYRVTNKMLEYIDTFNSNGEESSKTTECKEELIELNNLFKYTAIIKFIINFIDVILIIYTIAYFRSIVSNKDLK